jgi:replication factor A3
VAGNGVQLIGKVNPDLSIKVLSSLDLGPGVGKLFLPLKLNP